MTRRTGVFLLFAAIVVALDQATKGLAASHLMPGESISVLGDFIRLTLVHNTGAAFGLFPGSRVPFIVVSVVAIGVVLYLFFRETYRSVANRVLLGCILGGAIGNLIDRVRLGYVVDFIDIGFGTARWPVFNAARRRPSFRRSISCRSPGRVSGSTATSPKSSAPSLVPPCSI
jgi:signal peptidase II